VRTVLIANIENGEKVVMVQGAENSRFLLKSVQAISIRGKGGRQDLNRDTSVEASVTSAVDLAHAACSERRLDFIGAEFRARGENHPCTPL
jgi:hypothetical protein